MITLSQTAVQEVKRLMTQEQKPNLGLRVAVKGGGCSGFSYQMGLEEAVAKQYDTIFEQDSVKILIDAKSDLYLSGTTIDYKNGLTGGGFEFQNPQAKKSCGCGHSFSA